jgi:hypothetical protein
MEEISKRIWKDYMSIRGGDFPNWYEGLSPIEVTHLYCAAKFYYLNKIYTCEHMMFT